MARYTVTPISSLTNESSAVNTLNTNFQSISDALELVLSRLGTAPNTMEADLDMNARDVINVGQVETDTLTIAGHTIDAASLTGGTSEIITVTVQEPVGKETVATATTGNISLTGEQTIDGVLTAASRVLVKDQTDKTKNGIYISASGAWTRSTDADESSDFAAGMLLYVDDNGGVNGNKLFSLTVPVGSFVLGTTQQTYVAVNNPPRYRSLKNLPAATTAYTLTSSDGNRVIFVLSNSPVTITLPSSTTVSLPNNAELSIVKAGVGNITLVADSGVTLQSPYSPCTLKNRWEMINLKKRGAATWHASGGVLPTFLQQIIDAGTPADTRLFYYDSVNARGDWLTIGAGLTISAGTISRDTETFDWGAIGGDILDQTDLQAALALKADIVGSTTASSVVNDSAVSGSSVKDALNTLNGVIGSPYTDEKAQDAIAAMFAAGTQTGITVTYNDGSNSMSLTNTVTQYTDENAQDALAAAFAAGTHSGITISYNDASNSFSFTSTGGYTDENAQDAIASLLSTGTSTGLTFTYNDGSNSMDVAVNTATFAELTAASVTNKFLNPSILGNLWKKGSDVASASTVTFGNGGYYHITGTTTITALAFTNDLAGRSVTVEFDASLLLTHNASSLILPGGQSITTAAGDTAVFVSEASGNFRCTSYVRAKTYAAIEIPFDGGGAVITNGTLYEVEVPFNCTIEQVTMLSTISGSLVVDIYKTSYSDYDGGSTHPVSGDKITASAPPTISSAYKSQDSTLTGWTKGLSRGDVLRFIVTGTPASIQKCTVSLSVSRNG